MTIKRIFSGVKRLASARVIVLVVSVVLAGVLASGVAMTAGPGPAKAAFPGKNGRIAFTSNRTTEDNPNGYEQIFTMKPDGSGLKQITHYDNPAYYDIDGPSYSADGRRIAYALGSIPAPGEVESHLYTIPARGGAPKQITISSDLVLESPSWSPDGKWIAFDAASPEGGINVYIIPARGGVPEQLTHTKNYAETPAWSPNGKRIAYGATSANGDLEVYTIPARGGTPERVTYNRTDDYSPAWSPDGKMIAYTNWDDLGEDIIQIYTVPAHGGRPMQLTHTNYSFAPAWSPDGNKIAYENWKAGGQIFTIPAKGGSPKQITHAGSNGAPDWQPLP